MSGPLPQSTPDRLSTPMDRPHRTLHLAVCASVLIHFALLVAAGLLIVLPKISAPGTQTLVLNFASVPESSPADRLSSLGVSTEEVEETAAPREATAPRPEPAADLKSLQEHPPTRPRGGPNPSPLEDTDRENNLDSRGLTHEKFADPDAEPHSSLRRPRKPVGLASSLRPLPLERLQLKPVPATISIGPKQAASILRKVRGLVRWDLAHSSPDTTLVWDEGSQTYTARVHYEAASTPSSLDEAVVRVSTEKYGRPVSTQLRLRRLAFSNFAQFVDNWDPQVAIHDDEMDGRFHTNSSFSVSSRYGVKPKFKGKVTTAAYDVRGVEGFPFIDKASIFPGGIETAVDAIRLPRNFKELPETVSVGPDLHKLKEDTWITFQRDGSYTWGTDTQPGTRQQRRLSDEAYYIVGDKNVTIHVRGVVHGKVLVFSAKKIVIDDDLVYANPPELSHRADDYLGLVCEKDIEIADPDVTGPRDLEIHAAVLAKGRFRVRHLFGNGSATLRLYGSLTAGSLSATEPRYATRITYDRRLEEHRPPRFPMTDRFEVVDWNRNWTLALP